MSEFTKDIDPLKNKGVRTKGLKQEVELERLTN